MSEHDAHTKQLLTEVLANQQSLHEVMVDLANRYAEVEKKVTELMDRKNEESVPWLDTDTDPLYPHARQLVVEVGRASTSLLQRVFRVGYARAATLMDLLEENAVIGPSDGSRPRTILLTQEEINDEVEAGNDTHSLDSDTDEGELYEQAKALVLAGGRVSTSYIQRKLRVGYSRAARLMDMLEEKGVIGPVNGAEPRTVL